MSPASEPWASGGGIWEAETPHGPGFKVVATPEMTTPWGGKTAFLADVGHLVRGAGYTEDWSGMFMFPAAGNPDGFPRTWHSGVLWEFHTASASGHHIAIDNSSFATPRFRVGVHDPRVVGEYRFVYGSRGIDFDRWIPWRMRVKWSYGDDGFIQVWVDGELLADFTGPTLKQGESPYLQFGYYATEQLRNEVWHAAVRKS
ncbi:MAG: heparin lyase I family protein [Actinobacteria bacterium]|nr:heparin lyase I family protein [Actinomycetota bacterium]